MIALTDEQQLLLENISTLAEEEFVDQACTWQGEFPWPNVEQLANHEFIGINLPEKYGGQGMTEFEAMLAIETVGRICPDTAGALYVMSMVSPRVVDMFGSEEAKQKYLPPVCSGDSAFSIAISEPDAGSDVGSMNTSVEHANNGDFLLTGEKIWVGYLSESDAAVVWTKFPDGNLGTVIMDLDAQGFEVKKYYENMAGQTQAHFTMDDVRIPSENVLAQGKEAFKQQLEALNWERLGSTAYANAIACCALEKALDYANDREQFDQPIGDFQGMGWKLADAATELEASRSLMYRAATNAIDRQRVPDRLETSIAKLHSAQMVEKVVSESLQTFGARGYQSEHPLEYLYRLQRSRRIATGSDEMMKNSIADEVLETGLTHPI